MPAGLSASRAFCDDPDMLSRAIDHDRIPTQPDLAVIGNGALGLAIAIEYRRRQPDATVVVIGPTVRPGSASMAAGIMVAAHAELEAATLTHPAGRAKFEIIRAAVEHWPAWLEELAAIAGIEPPSLRRGTVVLDNPNVSDFDASNFDAILKGLDDDDAPFERLDPAEIDGYRPRPHLRASRAIRIENDGAADAFAVMDLLDQAATKLGVHRVDARVESIADAVIRLEDGRSLRAEATVIACGAASDSLIQGIPELTGRIPRVLHGTGVGLRCRMPDPATIPDAVLRTPNRGAGLGVYYVPSNDGQFYLGATNVVSMVPREHPRLGSLHLVLQSAMDEISPELRHAECRTVTGHRPITEDGHALLGATSVPGLWIATGTRRDGVTAAPEIATRLVNEILDDGVRLPDALRPERRPVSTLDREAGIELAVRSRVIGPRTLDASTSGRRLEDTVRRHVERLYDRAGLSSGVPAELLDAYADGHLHADDLVPVSFSK